jgi:hypothetical protein
MSSCRFSLIAPIGESADLEIVDLHAITHPRSIHYGCHHAETHALLQERTTALTAT